MVFCTQIFIIYNQLISDEETRFCAVFPDCNSIARGVQKRARSRRFMKKFLPGWVFTFLSIFTSHYIHLLAILSSVFSLRYFLIGQEKFQVIYCAFDCIKHSRCHSFDSLRLPAHGPITVFKKKTQKFMLGEFFQFIF